MKLSLRFVTKEEAKPFATFIGHTELPWTGFMKYLKEIGAFYKPSARNDKSPTVLPNQAVRLKRGGYLPIWRRFVP